MVVEDGLVERDGEFEGGGHDYACYIGIASFMAGLPLPADRTAPQ
ncbi:hypothetical protein [Streptomyces camelliae]|uniref:Uncharacterized protein n=1 Tax=Streptomyces camelliae TaxID=3004093 RepID=A0ABY7P056_9ACTN|nr:hypothetical protein [Streptomyces sp. HUAS 2-6]WBO61653.1 hypothetical protein O1G22_01620 [Streptomyces sp. HUAS 2-6]